VKPWVVVSYYTIDAYYKKLASNFVETLTKHKIPYHVKPIEGFKDWKKNTCYKPEFLLSMLHTYPGTNIIWVDCDAEFNCYPWLFDVLDCNVAAFEFDRREYYGHGSGKELLSGTLYLQNNATTIEFVEKWKSQCGANPHVFDQKSLEVVLEGDYYRLPASYCQIFDSMSEVKDPVITHFQASRRVRRDPSVIK